MIFRQATIRLTVVFTLILLVLFGAFAAGVYLFVVSSFDYDSALNTGNSAVDAAEQSFADLRFGLATGYLALVIVLPVICFLMVRLVLRPARRGFEAQQRFVDDASHEFRTPLSIIQGELELVISRPRPRDEYVTAITTALDEVDHLNTLTSDLLLLTRANTATLMTAFQPVSLGTVVDRAVDSYSRGPQTGRLTVTGSDVIVYGSDDLLIRAVGNIIDNALKFSPPKSKVSVTVSEHADHARIVVTDTGTGLTSGEKTHAFERFWRAETSRTLPGQGLGLALVKQIIEAHHGTVKLASNEGHGTRVTLEIPTDAR
ncbi:sensor histidine kinase [Subtercola frigoramans]|uniref:Sensor-like histidine kinase SenX3 n=1 Tax=Subtercola frigoramans TaxID=120298 RepID=A0ABS2L0V1_9MICO|nr:HAMP domain-containing sensor histidine kinase [Subtercola frigoramans]MBM7470571.1 signal transduction histidine kinase [Subtercola frigoramans]MBM7471177.1 signal transduction histidine kinase [Subtercola frigoramans]